MLTLKIILIIFLFLTIFPQQIFAQEINCDHRYITAVNPVRSRNLWLDKSLKPLQDQYNLATKYDFPVTWLLQYDVLQDKQLLAEIHKFNNDQELGAFLEISGTLAKKSRVIYPYDAPWFAPSSVFLSGYSQSDRRKLIDRLFIDFNDEFGLYPKSVGAWWIDSYSLDYMREKYGIVAAMIVADQTTTDNYGVWGQWWGVPYYPTKANILTPASTLENKQNTVIIQWAQRDPLRAYGDGYKYSNYSLQANDYTDFNLDTKYFKEIASVYLDCQNPIGQVTVGLETGIESIESLSEYQNQLATLKEMKVSPVTMSEFAKQFTKVYPEFPKQVTIEYKNTKWILNTSGRENVYLSDKISYKQGVAFSDYFVSDKLGFLNRKLDKQTGRENNPYVPWFILISAVFGLVMLGKKQLKIWFINTLFLTAAFGLILRSNYQYGWQIFYGPKIPSLQVIQIILTTASILFVWIISKWKKINDITLWLIPLSLGLDFIVQSLRFSYISGKYYFGVATDALHFIGISYERPFGISFVDQDFPSYLAAGLLRFDFNKIWDNLYLSLIVYPLAHVFVAISLGLVIVRVPMKVRMAILVIFVILFVFQLVTIFQADPRLVQ